SASVQITGLEIGATYHFRVVADNEAGSTNGPDQTFTTVASALLDGEFVSDVTATSATLQAQANPLGSSTTVHLQIGSSDCSAEPSACTEVPTAAGISIGGGESEETAST